jgi:hypothetical protein
MIHSFEVRFLSGSDAFGLLRLVPADFLNGWDLAGLRCSLADIDDARCGVGDELPKSRGQSAFGLSLDHASAIDNN